MKVKRLAAMLGLFGLLGTAMIGITGCAAPSSAAALAASVNTEPKAAGVPSPTVAGVPGSFAGDGSSALSVWIEPGSWIFRLTHEGSSGLEISVSDPSGKQIEALEQAAGEAPALRSLNIRKSGLYRLDIAVDGHWTIDVRGCTCSAESG